MTKQSSGAFFRTPVDSSKIIARLHDQSSAKARVIGPDSIALEGTCDSRNGGHRQLVFTTRRRLSTGNPLTESLILIDDIPEQADQGANQFCTVADPRAAFIDTLEWLIRSVGVDAHQRDFTHEASISPSANIARGAIIERGVEIGVGSIVCDGAVIKAGTRVGDNTIIRENTVVGTDGITIYRAADGRLLKFPHVGGVAIGDNTEIGANVVVAGGILTSTFVGSNVVVGNLCNVGHGVCLESDVWISVGALIGGHATVRTGATIAMGVAVRDNVVIDERASLGMGSIVVRGVAAGHSMFGNPAKRLAGLKTGPSR